MMPQAAHAATAASSTARPRIGCSVDGVASCVVVMALFGSARAAGSTSGAARRGSGAEPGTEKDERAVVVSGAEAFDADAARVAAIRADDHDVVAVAQVLVVVVVGARLGFLIVGERIGHLVGGSGAEVSRSVGVAGVFAIVARDIRRNVLLQQHDSENQGHHGGRGQPAGEPEQG